MLAAVLVAYSPSLSPPALHARNVEFAAAKAQILVDTKVSNLTDAFQNSFEPPNLALSYALFLQSDAARAALGRMVGLAGKDIAASGPFTLLLGRTNFARKLPALPDPRRVDSRYRLVTDVDGARPVITLYSQAPTTREAVALVDGARALLVAYVAHQEAAHPISEPGAIATLRPLGPAEGGMVDPGARLQLMAFVFVFVLVSGGSLVYARERRLRSRSTRQPARAGVDRLDEDLPGSDDWPHTRRLLPWALAGFMAMLFLVPFDAISLPIHLPLDSTLDRPVVVALVMLWFSSLCVVTGAARPRIKLTRVHFAALAFFAVCCVGVAINGHALVTMGELTLVLKKLALLASYLVFFLIVASVLRPREVPRFAALMVVLGVIVAVGAILEYRMKFNPFYTLWGKLLPVQAPPDLYGHDAIGRLTIYGPTSQPLELAALIAMVLPFGLIGAIEASTRRRRLLYSLAVGLLLAGGLATVRKTSVVAPLAGILVLMAYRPRVVMRQLVPLGLALSVIIHFTSPGAIGSLFFQLQPNNATNVLTTTDRAARYDAVRPDVMSHLLVGRGFQSYDPHKYRILDNEYLALLIGVGLIGLIAYVAIYVAMMSAAHAVIRRPDRRRASLALAASASVAVIAVASALFDVLSFPHVPYLLFFIAAMITALREPSPAPEPARVITTAPPRDHSSNGADPPPRRRHWAPEPKRSGEPALT